MLFIDHVSIKVGVANIHWVTYLLVSSYTCTVVDEKNVSLLIAVNLNFNRN